MVLAVHFWRNIVFVALVLTPNLIFPFAQAQQINKDHAGVMESFTQLEKQKKTGDIATKDKHQILFFMGFALLILLLLTAGLGIAMGVYGKRVFVPHMLSAGLSVTLAIVHSIVAMVWFFPF